MANKPIIGSKLLLMGVIIVDTYEGKLSPPMNLLMDGVKLFVLCPCVRHRQMPRSKRLVHAHPLISRDMTGSLALFKNDDRQRFWKWLVASFSLHQEFDELQKAGLSLLSILQMATLNGAKFLNRTAGMGSVEVSKNANLILLNTNLLTDIQHLHDIYAVVRAGVYYSSDRLDALKNKVAAKQSAHR